MPEEDKELPRLNGQTLCVVPHDGEKASLCVIDFLRNKQLCSNEEKMCILIIRHYSLNGLIIDQIAIMLWVQILVWKACFSLNCPVSVLIEQSSSK